MLVVLRFDIPESDADAFLPQAQTALQAFAARPGFLRGRIGRATDEPGAWVVATEWEGVGAYRRSLSAYDVKLLAPFLGSARPEASAFEVLASEDA